MAEYFNDLFDDYPIPENKTYDVANNGIVKNSDSINESANKIDNISNQNTGNSSDEINNTVSEVPKQDFFFCSNCGKKISVDSKFCRFCGSKIEDLETTNQTSEIKSIENTVHKDNSTIGKVEVKPPKSPKTKQSKIANEIVANVKMLGISIIIWIVYILGFIVYHHSDIKSCTSYDDWGKSCYDDDIHLHYGNGDLLDNLEYITEYRLQFYKEDLLDNMLWSIIISPIIVILGRYSIMAYKWVITNKTD
jgi:RNA polymerase subunit RPABC4/transcription elongation factor Spt4